MKETAIILLVGGVLSLILHEYRDKSLEEKPGWLYSRGTPVVEWETGEDGHQHVVIRDWDEN